MEHGREYFSKSGLEIQIDDSLSVSAMVSRVLDQAYKRQREMPGTIIARIVLEHLIGAKLSLALGEDKITHKIASTIYESSDAPGDFHIEETVIHVTTAPSPALINKCKTNIHNGLRPIIICPTGMKTATQTLAFAEGLEDRIEVYEAQEFISMNINEWSGFSASKLMHNSIRLVNEYNRIIELVEPDKSLKIERKG